MINDPRAMTHGSINDIISNIMRANSESQEKSQSLMHTQMSMIQDLSAAIRDLAAAIREARK